MLAFCFCCNSWCKWLLESPGSLSASGFNRLYPGCGRFFFVWVSVCALNRETRWASWFSFRIRWSVSQTLTASGCVTENAMRA